jgi:hypothetical protein
MAFQLLWLAFLFFVLAFIFYLIGARGIAGASMVRVKWLVLFLVIIGIIILLYTMFN